MGNAFSSRLRDKLKVYSVFDGRNVTEELLLLSLFFNADLGWALDS